MYNQFFGFAERPFRLAPDPAYFYLSAHHEEALAHLKYAVSEGEGFVEITGEVGTGKTLLCRTFLEQLDDQTESAYIFNPRLSARELIQAVNDEFGIAAAPGGEGIKALIDSLNAFLMGKKAQGKKVVLVIDEAQNLGRDVLEQVRLLSNLETTRSKLLQIILVGQPELSELLDSHELRQLGQRITLSCRLRPLTRKETGQYIRHRLQVASRKTADIFTRSAINKIHRYSGGIPRLINIAGDRALLCAYGFNRHKVSGAIADAAIAELASRGEVYRRGAVAFSSEWPLRLGLLLVLAGVAIIFLFQSDKSPLLYGRAASEAPAARQTQIAAMGVRQDLPASVSHVPANHEEASGKSQEIATAGNGLLENGTDAAEAIDTETVFSVSANNGRASVVGEASEQAVAAVEGGALADDVLESLAPTDSPLTISHDLVSFSDYLAAVPAEGSRYRALETVLTRWSVNAAAGIDMPEIVDDAAFFAAMAAVNGLAVQRIAADPGLIRVLNLWTIISFDGPPDHGPIYLAVVGADDETMTLDDGLSGIRITAPDHKILRQMPKDAYVFWKNFFNYQGIIPLTAPKEAVVTLKLHLRDLGHDQTAIGPDYDPATRRMVERIQAEHGIPVDGYVGPLTLMTLYNETPGLSAPRLREPEPKASRSSSLRDPAENTTRESED
jgi:general secretion pathway protein A